MIPPVLVLVAGEKKEGRRARLHVHAASSSCFSSSSFLPSSTAFSSPPAKSERERERQEMLPSSRLVRCVSLGGGIVFALLVGQLLYTYAYAHRGPRPAQAPESAVLERPAASNVVPSDIIVPHSYTEEEGEYLAMCVGNRDQPVDLQEFFRHHYHHHGVRHFYVGDDGSNPPLSTFEYPGVPREALDFEYYTPDQHTEAMQVDMYNRCAERAAGRHAWMAFFDEDEMLEMIDPAMKIQDFLRGFEDEGALGINWILHGSNGIRDLSPVDDRQIFLTCFPQYQEPGSKCDDNRHVKTIVNMKYFGSCMGPHQFAMTDGKREVGEHHDDIDGSPFRYPDTKDFVQLHHYAVRSLEEYIVKKHRGNGMNQPKGWEFWDHTMECATAPCGELISRYRP